MAQEKRSVMTLPSDPVKISNKRADREAQKAFEKAKLGTDMSYLDREVLSWNFETIDGARPPFDVRSLRRVPLTFKSMAHYREIYQPLLFLECWEHLVNTKEEMGDAADVSVSMTLEGVASVDSFLELTFAAPTKDVKLASLSEQDLVNCVLEGASGPASNVFMGKVLNLAFRKEEVRATIKARSGDLITRLRTGSKYVVIKLMSLTTVHREFAAMQALDYFPLRDEIYKPRNTERPRVDPKKVAEIQAVYGVNEPQ